MLLFYFIRQFSNLLPPCVLVSVCDGALTRTDHPRLYILLDLIWCECMHPKSCSRYQILSTAKRKWMGVFHLLLAAPVTSLILSELATHPHRRNIYQFSPALSFQTVLATECVTACNKLVCWFWDKPRVDLLFVSVFVVRQSTRVYCVILSCCGFRALRGFVVLGISMNYLCRLGYCAAFQNTQIPHGVQSQNLWSFPRAHDILRTPLPNQPAEVFFTVFHTILTMVSQWLQWSSTGRYYHSSTGV